MSSTELRERLKGFSASGWEWSETNGMVSADPAAARAASWTLVCLSSRQQLSRPDANSRNPKSRRLSTWTVPHLSIASKADYSDYRQGTSANSALCAARRLRALCDDASEKALEMGRQIFCVAHELISFHLDGLGLNAHTDREGLRDSGCRVWRWPNDSEVGGCHAGHGVRYRLCQR